MRLTISAKKTTTVRRVAPLRKAIATKVKMSPNRLSQKTKLVALVRELQNKNKDLKEKRKVKNHEYEVRLVELDLAYDLILSLVTSEINRDTTLTEDQKKEQLQKAANTYKVTY